jgi:hypothetical protein
MYLFTFAQRVFRVINAICMLGIRPSAGNAWGHGSSSAICAKLF